MPVWVRRFLVDDGGATAVEYALIGSGIFLAIVSIVSQVGVSVGNVFANVSNNL